MFIFPAQSQVLGFIVSSEGVEADPEKVQKLIDWARPTNQEDVRRFLGFCGYYRKFVKGVSNIAGPLNELMPATRKVKGKSKTSHKSDWKWGEDQETAFVKLKEILSSPLILGYPDYNEQFNIHTDASLQGLGAILYQNKMAWSELLLMLVEVQQSLKRIIHPTNLNSWL